MHTSPGHSGEELEISDTIEPLTYKGTPKRKKVRNKSLLSWFALSLYLYKEHPRGKK
jgi:hypothetical protein